MLLILLVLSPLAVLAVLVVFLGRAIDQSAERAGRSHLDDSKQTAPNLPENE